MMNKKEIKGLAQRYLGMTPADLGCENWAEMQEKFADELSRLIDSPDLHYIQCGHVGNAMLWWAQNGQGYTTNFEKAGKFSKAYAVGVINNRPDKDSAWLCSHVDGTVDAQVLCVEDYKLDSNFRILGKKK